MAGLRCREKQRAGSLWNSRANAPVTDDSDGRGREAVETVTRCAYDSRETRMAWWFGGPATAAVAGWEESVRPGGWILLKTLLAGDQPNNELVTYNGWIHN